MPRRKDERGGREHTEQKDKVASTALKTESNLIENVQQYRQRFTEQYTIDTSIISVYPEVCVRVHFDVSF